MRRWWYFVTRRGERTVLAAPFAIPTSGFVLVPVSSEDTLSPRSRNSLFRRVLMVWVRSIRYRFHFPVASTSLSPSCRRRHLLFGSWQQSYCIQIIFMLMDPPSLSICSRVCLFAYCTMQLCPWLTLRVVRMPLKLYSQYSSNEFLPFKSFSYVPPPKSSTQKTES